MVLTDQLYRHVFHFCGRVGIGVGMGRGGGEKLRLKLTSAKVEVEVEAELGNISLCSLFFPSFPSPIKLQYQLINLQNQEIG